MKKTILVLTLVPALTFAVTAEQKEAAHQANIERLKQQGLPTPGSGVQLVPQESMKADGWRSQQFKAESSELKSKGYVNRSSDRAYELIHIQAKINKMRPLQAKMHKGTESHLRMSAQEIPFAYSYVGAPKDAMTEFYGIAPVGTYANGWTGAVEFFKTSFAHCTYTENNMVAAHGAARIAEEEATYDVNGKITLVDVEGNENTGYLYRVNWFDNVFNRNLECATNVFSQSSRLAVIELAKKIDGAY